MNTFLDIAPNVEELYKNLAKYWENIAQQAIEQHGSFFVALSGGSTPKKFYELLASSPYKDDFPWGNTHVFFGDERCVATNHVDSNFRMANESMLQQLPIPASHIHPIEIDLNDIPRSAEMYRSILQSTLPKSYLGIPQLDLVLLGLGDDGHTASLFPDTDILQESEKLVASVFVDKLDTYRISLTYPTINEARNIAFLVAGEGKATIVHQILSHEKGEMFYPVQRVRAQQEMIWFMDQAAANELSLEIVEKYQAE